MTIVFYRKKLREKYYPFNVYEGNDDDDDDDDDDDRTVREIWRAPFTRFGGVCARLCFSKK